MLVQTINAPPAQTPCEHKSTFLLSQDVDSAYMTKVDLESQVDGFQDQINFLRAVYEEVSSSFPNYKSKWQDLWLCAFIKPHAFYQYNFLQLM